MATLREAIQYAQNNPNTDFARELEAGIKSGQFNKVGEQEGLDLVPFNSTQPVAQGNKGIPGVLAGAAKSVAGLASGTAELGYKAITGGALGPVATPIVNKARQVLTDKTGVDPQQVFDQAQEDLKANTPAEKLGKTAGDIATFFVPAGEAAKAEQALSGIAKTSIASKAIPLVGEKAGNIAAGIGELGAKSAVRAVEGGGVVAAQTGGELDDTKDAALISALFPVAGKAVSSIADVIKSQGKEFAPKLINSLIKPSKADFAYGKNPGKAVADAGIVASNLDDLAVKIGEAKNQTGSKIGRAVEQATKSGKMIDASDFLDPINEKIAQLNKTPKTNAAAISRLEALKDDLLTISSEKQITPTQAFEFKQVVGDIATFTGNVSDDKAVNSAAQDVYRKAKQAINKSAKGIKIGGKTIEELNESYGGLLSAEKATVNRAAVAERNNLLSLGSNIGGATGAIGAAVVSGGAAIPTILTGLIGAGTVKALESPRIKTNIASWLAKTSPEEKAKVFKAYPAVRGAIIKLLVGESN